MRDVNIKAVSFGVLVSLAAIMVLGALLIAVFGGHLLDTEMGEEEFQAAVNALLLSPTVMFWTFAAGFCTTTLGAFTTARSAKRALFANTTAYLVVSCVLNLLVADDSYPLWADVVDYLLMLPAAYLGVFLASRRRVTSA